MLYKVKSGMVIEIGVGCKVEIRIHAKNYQHKK